MSGRNPRAVVQQAMRELDGRSGWDEAGHVLGALTDEDVWELARVRGVPRCETCRWWSRHAAGWANPEWLQERERLFGDCNASLDEDRPIPQGCDDDEMPLITHEGFGCVEWDPHDTEGTA